MEEEFIKTVLSAFLNRVCLTTPPAYEPYAERQGRHIRGRYVYYPLRVFYLS